MEPRIQYAQTRDGVGIAFWTIGEGSPLVCMTNIIWSHAQMEWRFPEMRRWFERLADRRKLVRFDARGTGLSQGTVDEYSLQSVELDLEAVVDRLRLNTFALFASMNAGLVAIAYAAHHPERVSHVVLWCSWAGPSDYQRSRWQALEALQPLMDRDWKTYTEARAHIELGWSEPELAHRYAAFLGECTTPETAWRAYRAIDEFDVTSLLAQITSPTLVLHRRQFAFWDVEVSKNLAARIPDARFALLEGVAAAPYLGDADAVASAIDEFLGEGGSASPYPVGLTQREVEVLRLVAEGRSNREIAEELVISTNTVDRHVSHILAKVGAANRAEAASYATRQGLLS